MKKTPKKPASRRSRAPETGSATTGLSVVILAAGQGKRMRSDLPKVLQPLAGKPLLQHVLDTAAELAPAALHVVYGHGGDAVRAACTDPAIQWWLQAEQHGTGHALLQAMPGISDDHQVLVLYGDVPLLRADTLRELLKLAAGQLALLTVNLADPTGYGRVLRDSRGRVRSIVEQKDATKAQGRVREVNTGVMVLPARPLKKWLAELRSDNAQGEYYLTDVIAMARKAKMRIAPLVAGNEAEVQGVNDKQQLSQLEAVLRAQLAAEAMRSGATLADPTRFDQRGTLILGRDVFIDANVLFEGKVQLGDRVRVGPNCVLRNMTVGADTVIHPNCVLEDSSIGSHCSVGPFARLRPNAQLFDYVHIGNFVEVKNSVVGRGSKANHLSYLGDATIGEKVNVGAGTICCNYDGANKSRTVIEDGAFIGSGSMLVAPVTVGAGATIGAGSTITKDALPGKLTLSRGRQITVEGWQRPIKRPR
jgi:bifunctional UDP-N-acetylglucosamine pyrophosphorylase/glucosamine-1-phosphate N-acetyltransferase